MTPGPAPPYPPERALEHAAFALGAVPTGIYGVLLPVWRVSVRADVVQQEEYDLIDHFLERGIAQGGLDTVPDLARFLSLDRALVGQAVRYLVAIGHLTEDGGHVALTPLGRRSVRDGKRYVSILQDRRTLLFDALASTPLTRPYYDSEFGLLEPDEAEAAAAKGQRWRVSLISPTAGLRADALSVLAAHPDRDRYNLPERIDVTERLREELVFLPSYLVRAVSAGDRAHLLVYTKAAEESDRELTRACERSPRVVRTMETEEAERRSRDDAFRVTIEKWLSIKGLADHRPTTTASGWWRVTLPASCFGPEDDAVPLSKVGSFVVRGGGFFHVWCRDESVRRRALIDRVEPLITRRTSLDRATAQARLDRIAHQLSLSPVTLDDVRRVAAAEDRKALVDRLDRLE